MNTLAINIAVVGIGWAGSRLVEAAAELANRGDGEPDVQVTMLIDSDAAHLKTKADEFGVDRTSTELTAALSDPEVHAVSIATPHPHHAGASVEASEAGKHVIVEKPMAVSVEEADRMMAAAKANGVKLFVAENVPYSAETRTLREIVSTGKYTGDLTFATVIAGFRTDSYGYPGRRAWLAEPDAGGSGTWLLHGVHTVAQLRAVFGEVKTVYARETKTSGFSRPDLEATISCTLTMESGMTVQLVQSCETRYAPQQTGTTLFGERGVVHSNRERAIARSTDIYPDLSDPLRIEHPELELSEYALELQAFADWVIRGNKPLTDGASERQSLAVIQAGYESAASGQPVDLKERFG